MDGYLREAYAAFVNEEGKIKLDDIGWQALAAPVRVVTTTRPRLCTRYLATAPATKIARGNAVIAVVACA